ncbi:solute carrier family 35 member F1-like protein isoform X1 [Tanacetum coccineum]|uniref:Solute carrier family 35 member F1-like protein isoform X1 n=1 Tax=Tanacetum coccineum TaxID=301880 RepID=A0ABQ5HWY1_9ASTR
MNTNIILSSRRSDLWSVVSVLLLGQFVSIILALLNFTSSLTANLGANSPVTLGFFGYLALTIVNGSILLYQRLNSAYYFTSITSVALLDCWTVAWVILFTRLFLGTRYSLWQFIGASICGLGLCLVFLSDAGVGGGGGSNILLGDLLVIGGTVFFALSNVGQEYCVKKIGLVEVLAMVGAFGMLFSVIQIAIVERKSLEAIKWSTELILTFFGYTVGFFIFYTLTPLMLKVINMPRATVGDTSLTRSLPSQNDGASRASTPSPTTYLNSLRPLDQQYDVPTSFEQNDDHLFECQTDLLNQTQQMHKELRGGFKLFDKALQGVFGKKKK